MRCTGFLVLTITVHKDQEPQARKLAESLTPSAHLSYALGGTLKYELPKDQVGGVCDSFDSGPGFDLVCKNLACVFVCVGGWVCVFLCVSVNGRGWVYVCMCVCFSSPFFSYVLCSMLSKSCTKTRYVCKKLGEGSQIRKSIIVNQAAYTTGSKQCNISYLEAAVVCMYVCVQ